MECQKPRKKCSKNKGVIRLFKSCRKFRQDMCRKSNFFKFNNVEGIGDCNKSQFGAVIGTDWSQLREE